MSPAAPHELSAYRAQLGRLHGLLVLVQLLLLSLLILGLEGLLHLLEQWHLLGALLLVFLVPLWQGNTASLRGLDTA